MISCLRPHRYFVGCHWRNDNTVECALRHLRPNPGLLCCIQLRLFTAHRGKTLVPPSEGGPNICSKDFQFKYTPKISS